MIHESGSCQNQKGFREVHPAGGVATGEPRSQVAMSPDWLQLGASLWGWGEMRHLPSVDMPTQTGKDEGETAK